MAYLNGELKEIKTVPISELIPYVNNARKHSEMQIQQIAASIKEFGFNNPILIDSENGIIAGHGRMEGARLLGLENVPCIEVKHLTEAQKKAFIIADNQIATNSTWNEEILKLELEDIDEKLLTLVGFSEDELNLINNGWSSDIELPNENENLDYTMIRIRVADKDSSLAKTLITEILNSNDIEHDTQS
tara:strand:+ start:706 stop:1272 length:567 start_codon:yes stop_codon:yes gene_type:complete